MHTAKWLDVLQKFEDDGWTSWTKDGNNLKFNVTDDYLPLLLQRISGRKISLPSIKKNMTLYGFKISNRSRLEFHNSKYTKHGKDIEGLTLAVQIKNKQDNDRKKMKKSASSNGIRNVELLNQVLSSRLQNSIAKSENIVQETFKCETKTTEILSELMIDEDRVSNCESEITQNSTKIDQIQLGAASPEHNDFEDEIKISKSLLSQLLAQSQSQGYQQGFKAGIQINITNFLPKN